MKLKLYVTLILAFNALFCMEQPKHDVLFYPECACSPIPTPAELAQNVPQFSGRFVCAPTWIATAAMEFIGSPRSGAVENDTLKVLTTREYFTCSKNPKPTGPHDQLIRTTILELREFGDLLAINNDHTRYLMQVASKTNNIVRVKRRYNHGLVCEFRLPIKFKVADGDSAFFNSSSTRFAIKITDDKQSLWHAYTVTTKQCIQIDTDLQLEFTNENTLRDSAGNFFELP